MPTTGFALTTHHNIMPPLNPFGVTATPLKFLNGTRVRLSNEYVFPNKMGTPAHHAVTVRNWLNSEFNEHWIGRDDPILWPPRSPDLTILDFYLWGRLKQIVYREPLENDEEQLKIRIQNSVVLIN
ncbi:hypothetical protein NQ318_006930 [Aromia moschata]|uniref:Uncharacterized protein n=1 Tax=Aromia moschata TaxID=1265417 RepID=A0AAV8YMV0_9CUCU|nr:hypothetical protein NQ318_006930 [Aromia moschata]